MVPTTAENTTLRRTICSPLYILVEQHVHVVDIIYVRVHVFGKKGMKRHEKKGWLGAYYEQRARGTSVPSIFHVHPCNKKIYTSLEKMGCRRCDVWILVQCRNARGDVAPRRAGKWKPIIVPYALDRGTSDGKQIMIVNPTIDSFNLPSSGQLLDAMNSDS